MVSGEMAIDESNRRIYLITGTCLQSATFASVIEERMGVRCTIEVELKACVATVAMTSHPTLIIIDCCYIDRHQALAELEELPHRNSNHVMTALLNMPKNEGLEPHALSLGVRGVFYSGVDFASFSRGIDSVFNGQIWISREVLANALIERDHERTAHGHSQAILLTQRERQILSFISRGCSNDEIASQLNISSHTVRTHVYNLFKKINVPNRMQAALWAAEYL